jgi:UDP-N-acetylmuramate--alanine ligase
VGLGLGATVPQMAPGIAAFRGVERRFQLLGEAGGALVVDDYAHHPTEVRATIQAARAAAPERRLVVAFQPHLFSRTRDLAPEFGAALALADAVYLLDIYPSREKPIAGVTSDLIAAAMRSLGKPPTWQGPRTQLATGLAGAVRAGDLVITMGAGDVTRCGPELLASLGTAAA